MCCILKTKQSASTRVNRLLTQTEYSANGQSAGCTPHYQPTRLLEKPIHLSICSTDSNSRALAVRERVYTLHNITCKQKMLSAVIFLPLMWDPAEKQGEKIPSSFSLCTPESEFRVSGTALSACDAFSMKGDFFLSI